jgi:hypothetical protein
MAIKAFSKFAPSILKIYKKDKEAFWKAVMAPFLADQVSLVDWWGHLKVDLPLLKAFQGLDHQAQQTLRDFSSPLGFDLTQWKSHRQQYFKDAYPVFAFLAVWMEEEGLKDLVQRFDQILEAGVFAVAGYGILDENVDGDQSSPVEVLTAQALIAEYEHRVINIFGISKTNLEILRKMRTLFLEAEIREKFARGKTSPYHLNNPEDLGSKGANSVSPFMLSLELLGKAHQIDDYWQAFLLFGAAIQMVDDWQDLGKDLAAGHYSFVTLGHEELLKSDDLNSIIQALRSDQAHVDSTYRTTKNMIAQARDILERLGDRYLFRLVDVTELRVESFFKKELGLKVFE